MNHFLTSAGRSRATLSLWAALAAFSITIAEAGKPTSLEDELSLEKSKSDSLRLIVERKLSEVEKLRGFQRVSQELEQARQTLAAEEEKLAALEAQRVEADDELSAIQLAFEDYRDQYRNAERLAAKGEILDLSETKGDSYKESKVLGISALHLRVMRPDGTEGIPYKDLPAAIQDRFQFSDDEAAAYQRKLAQSDAARAKLFDDWKESQKGGNGVSRSSNLEKRLAETEALANVRREEGDKFRALSDEWREKAARFWKGMSKAKSGDQREGLEKTASKAEAKADEFLDRSSQARNEAVQLAREAMAIRAMINEKAEK